MYYVVSNNILRFYFESPRPDSSEYRRRNMRHSQTSAASSSSLAWLIIVLVASSREFSRTCSCHAFGISRPSLFPAWALRSGTEINVMTRAEPEVSWANVLERKGSNEDDKQLPVQQQQPPPQEQDASSELPSSQLPSSPPLTFEKYLTMSNKRVPVEIRYNSQQSGLRPFFLTVAKKVKDKYPDVVVQKTDLASLSSSGGGGEAAPGDSMVFEVLIDGKGVVGKAETKRQSIGNGNGGGSSGGVGSPVDLANGISVYVSMSEIDQAITKARRKRRPSTTYSQQGEDREPEGASAIRLEVLRLRQQQTLKQKAEGSKDASNWD